MTTDFDRQERELIASIVCQLEASVYYRDTGRNELADLHFNIAVDVAEMLFSLQDERLSWESRN